MLLSHLSRRLPRVAARCAGGLTRAAPRDASRALFGSGAAQSAAGGGSGFDHEAFTAAFLAEVADVPSATDPAKSSAVSLLFCVF